ncbi:MAG: BMP family ABC transporter substrate-binding protein [Oscillospiraceae bacterium]|jgi:basic membrane protein A|nr:BMP family ABC transporter substrate-binding protein [Oscillospiraceae bacterium]
MKKVLALLLALTLVFALAACGNQAADPSSSPAGSKSSESPGAETSDVKIGVILVHDENTGYDFAHIEGIRQAAAAVGVSDDRIVWKYNVSEDESCYDTATDLVEQGCGYIFSDSYGHQSYMQQAAEENPEVTFVAMTGDTAALSGLSNFKNAFNDTFQSRYVSGVVAGLKLAELVANGEVKDANKNADGTIKTGYVGAFPYAEVVSGYTAFYLGVKSIVENVAMSVTYTNSWYDPTAEAEAANALVSSGCIIISQHADSTGAPSACQALFDAGTTVYCVGYNIDMLSVAPDAALTSAQNDWSVYYTYAFGRILAGEEIATDWAEGYNEGAVLISELGASCAEGTAGKVAEIEAAIKDGSLNVFDTASFTVGGETVTSYLALDTDGDWAGDTGEAIENGVFSESTLRSAPYFGLRIDGITELNAS